MKTLLIAAATASIFTGAASAQTLYRPSMGDLYWQQQLRNQQMQMQNQMMLQQMDQQRQYLEETNRNCVLQYTC